MSVPSSRSPDRSPDPSPPDEDQPVRLVPVDASWGERYRRVGRELLAALGDAFDTPGGRVLEIHHVGSTAVPGLDAKPTLDVMARVDRWPLDETARTALASIGFVDHGEHGIAGRRFFTRGGHVVHLHVVAPGEVPMLRRHLAFRDLLAGDRAARRDYADLKRRLVTAHRGGRSAYVDGKHDWIRAVQARAVSQATDSMGFGPVERAVRALRAARDVPWGGWSIGGGWALDLVLGRPTRAHRDVDVVVDRVHADRVLNAASDAGVAFRLAGGPSPAGATVPDPADPGGPSASRFEGRDGGALATSPAEPADAALGGPLFWDVVLEARPGTEWRLRTDPDVRLPMTRAVVPVELPDRDGAGGVVRVPTLAPQVVLLTKARLSGRGDGTRDGTHDGTEEGAEDEDDLRRALARLEPEARTWLSTALRRGPRHRWADLLA